MDETVDTSKDCATMSAAKQKKLKQARLPFQTLSSPVSSNTTPKKRKLSPPCLSGGKDSKVSKVEKEESSGKTSELIEIDNSDNEDGPVRGPENSTSLDNITKEKKSEQKSSMKPGALTRLFQKVAATPPKPPPPRNESPAQKSIPVVILKRCDEKEIEEVSPESGNEVLATILPDSEDEEAESKKEVTEDKKEKLTNEDLNDSDSDIDNSSSDDEKNSNDDCEETAKNLSGNRTPTNKTAQQVALKKRRLTPKQLESAKKREEREKQKAERQIQRNEEKTKRRREREEQKKARKEKEEAEKEQKRKEREQKELKKQMEIEQKQKEKERKEKAKEEERKKREEAKEEEKRRKEEEKLEAERKKQKEASTFVSFFVAKKHDNKVRDEQKVDQTSYFMPFQVKADMRVAPLRRRPFTDEDKFRLDHSMKDSKDLSGQLMNFRLMKRNRATQFYTCKSGNTYPTEVQGEDESLEKDVIIEEDEHDNSNIVNQPATANQKHKPKLLFFYENRRPPYWGTWRKKSSKIHRRRPFAKDTDWFDYEVDSDEEWEEEEPGESLRGSDDEKDEENPDDNEYDVDNEFMVPHGYLSDEEAQADEEDEPSELQKDKLKILEEEFEAEMKSKTAKIKPRVIGCIWQGFFNVYPENTPQRIVDYLKERQAWVGETPIVLTPPAESEKDASGESGSSKKLLPEEAVPDLIRLVHGNTHGRPFLIKEFLAYWNKNHPESEIVLTKAVVSRKIKEISKRINCPDEGLMHLKTCWYVSEEYRKKYSLEDIRLPNQWSYSLTPKSKTVTEPPEVIEKSEKESKDRVKDGDKDQKKTVPLITMFTKKMTQEERQKQLQIKPGPSQKSSTVPNKPPKRVPLISVPRGHRIPRSSIITAFSRVNDGKKEEKAVSSTSHEPITISDDEETPMKKAKTEESNNVDDNDNGKEV